jgi:GntR family transcriptional regulator
VNQSQRRVPGGHVGRRDVHGDDLPSVQALRRIEADILTGRLRPGGRLAPERELSERLGVARGTLRRALLSLASRGLVEPRGRGGWVVLTAGVTEEVDAPPSLTEWAAARGYTVTSRVVQAKSRMAAPDEAADLRLSTPTRVFELERVRYVDGVPISLDRSILHPRLIPALEDVDFAQASLYATVRTHAAIVPSRAEVVARAVAATTRTASLLGIRARDPLLELVEVAFDQYDEPFETARLLNRGDRYAFATTLSARHTGARVDL